MRRRTAAESSADNNGSSTSSNNDHNDNFNNDADNETEEASDKETRLTLMEEVLLLGLKDKEVSRHDRSAVLAIRECIIIRARPPPKHYKIEKVNPKTIMSVELEEKTTSDDDIWQFSPCLCVCSLCTHSSGDEISLAKVSLMLRSKRIDWVVCTSES